MKIIANTVPRYCDYVVDARECLEHEPRIRFDLIATSWDGCRLNFANHLITLCGSGRFDLVEH